MIVEFTNGPVFGHSSSMPDRSKLDDRHVFAHGFKTVFEVSGNGLSRYPRFAAWMSLLDGTLQVVGSIPETHLNL